MSQLPPSSPEQATEQAEIVVPSPGYIDPVLSTGVRETRSEPAHNTTLQEQPETTTEVKETFDFAAVRTRVLVTESRDSFTAVEEVGLARLIRAGKAAEAALAKDPTDSQPRDAAAQRELEGQVAAGKTALEIFARGNRGMVVKLANLMHARYRHMPRLELEDLEQQANTELVRCILRFDPDAGHKFSTYAHDSIYYALRAYAQDKGRLIRHSRDMKRNVYVFRNLIDFGNTPEEAAASIGYTVETLLDVEKKLKRPDATSYDQAIAPNEGSETPLLELLDSEEGSLPFAERVDDQLSAHVAVQALSDWLEKRATHTRHRADIDPNRAYEILFARYGKGESPDDIAKQWGISRERVRQLAAATLRLIANELPPSVRSQIEAAGYTAPHNRTKQ